MIELDRVGFSAFPARIRQYAEKRSKSELLAKGDESVVYLFGWLPPYCSAQNLFVDDFFINESRRAVQRRKKVFVWKLFRRSRW